MKQSLLNNVIQLVEADLNQLRASALETHRSSTGDENKQEGKYDTRGLEASYLAGAQAEQVKQLEVGLHKLQALALTDEPDSAELGVIVVTSPEDGGADSQYFLLPAGGGIILSYEGAELSVVTPSSPIGGALIGQAIGDVIDVAALRANFISEIY